MKNKKLLLIQASKPTAKIDEEADARARAAWEAKLAKLAKREWPPKPPVPKAK